MFSAKVIILDLIILCNTPFLSSNLLHGCRFTRSCAFMCSRGSLRSHGPQVRDRPCKGLGRLAPIRSTADARCCLCVHRDKSQRLWAGEILGATPLNTDSEVCSSYPQIILLILSVNCFQLRNCGQVDSNANFAQSVCAVYDVVIRLRTHNRELDLRHI